MKPDIVTTNTAEIPEVILRSAFRKTFSGPLLNMIEVMYLAVVSRFRTDILTRVQVCYACRLDLGANLLSQERWEALLGLASCRLSV